MFANLVNISCLFASKALTSARKKAEKKRTKKLCQFFKLEQAVRAKPNRCASCQHFSLLHSGFWSILQCESVAWSEIWQDSDEKGETVNSTLFSVPLTTHYSVKATVRYWVTDKTALSLQKFFTMAKIRLQNLICFAFQIRGTTLCPSTEIK